MKHTRRGERAIKTTSGDAPAGCVDVQNYIRQQAARACNATPGMPCRTAQASLKAPRKKQGTLSSRAAIIQSRTFT